MKKKRSRKNDFPQVVVNAVYIMESELVEEQTDVVAKAATEHPDELIEAIKNMAKEKNEFYKQFPLVRPFKTAGDWEYIASPICPTPLEVERGIFRQLDDDWQECIYLTAPAMMEWSDPEKWTVSYFKENEITEKRTDEISLTFIYEEIAIEYVLETYGLDLSMEEVSKHFCPIEQDKSAKGVF